MKLSPVSPPTITCKYLYFKLNLIQSVKIEFQNWVDMRETNKKSLLKYIFSKII